jgi:hypothetical protein
MRGSRGVGQIHRRDDVSQRNLGCHARRSLCWRALAQAERAAQPGRSSLLLDGMLYLCKQYLEYSCATVALGRKVRGPSGRTRIDDWLAVRRDVPKRSVPGYND